MTSSSTNSKRKKYSYYHNNHDSDPNEISDFAVPLEAAFNRFCCFLLKKNLNELNNQNIARYKTWHQADFAIIESTNPLSIKEIKIENINFSLTEIFKRLDTKSIVNSTFEFLNKIINENPNIGGKGVFSNEMIKILSNIRKNAEKNYNNNPTISSFQQSSTNRNSLIPQIIPETQTESDNDDEDNEENDDHDNNENPNNSIKFVTDMIPLVESLSNDKNFRDLKHWIRRVLVKENNIKLLEFHLNNE